jgi:hypothetical protein
MKAVYLRVRTILGRIPLAQSLYSKLSKYYARSGEINELSSLIKENKIVLLHPYFQMDKNSEVTNEIVHLVVRDHLTVFGTVKHGKNNKIYGNFSDAIVLLRYPLAMLKIPASHEEYLKLVGDKTRNMIRKSEKYGYEIKEFIWNNHLDDIYCINTSKEERSSGVMHGWYTGPVKPRNHNEEEQRYLKYYGVFKEGKLCAYLHIVICGDHAFFKHFIGHAEHMNYGIMNALLSWTVRTYIGNSQIRWFNYGKGAESSFKKHAGFKGYATFIDLEGEQELLKFSQHVQARSWNKVIF